MEGGLAHNDRAFFVMANAKDVYWKSHRLREKMVTKLAAVKRSAYSRVYEVSKVRDMSRLSGFQTCPGRLFFSVENNVFSQFVFTVFTVSLSGRKQ